MVQPADPNKFYAYRRNEVNYFYHKNCFRFLWGVFCVRNTLTTNVSQLIEINKKLNIKLQIRKCLVNAYLSVMLSRKIDFPAVYRFYRTVIFTDHVYEFISLEDR